MAHADGVDGNRLGASGRPCEVAGERIAKAKTWPDSPRALAGRLRRAATFLRKIGIEIGFEREGRARTRTIRITTPPSPRQKMPGRTVRIVRTVRDPAKSNPGNGFAAPAVRTVGNACGR